jgi:capsule biosynthesis phosphatase
MDLDGTITVDDPSRSYADREPDLAVVAQMRAYHNNGFTIIIYSARNMQTYASSVGKITAHTLPIIVDWLRRHDIPYDEIHIGKPWCGLEGFYVDDRAVRPSEFVSLTLPQIQALLGRPSPPAGALADPNDDEKQP